MGIWLDTEREPLALAQQSHFTLLGLQAVFSKTFTLGAGISLTNHVFPAWRCLGGVYASSQPEPCRQLAFPKLSDVLTQHT